MPESEGSSPGYGFYLKRGVSLIGSMASLCEYTTIRTVSVQYRSEAS